MGLLRLEDLTEIAIKVSRMILLSHLVHNPVILGLLSLTACIIYHSIRLINAL